MKRPALFIAIVLMVLNHTLSAQHDGITASLTDLPQVVYLNPAARPQYNFSVGLPFSSLYFQYANSSVRLEDFTTRNQEDDLNINLDQLSQTIRNKNYLTITGESEIFRIGVKLHPRFYFTTSLQAKSFFRTMLPGDLIAMVINRDVSNGTTLQIAPELDVLAYAEIALRGSYVVTRKLNLGLAIKNLRGIAQATTGGSELMISRNNEDISLRLALDGRSSGYQLDEDIELEQYRDYLKNNGWAFDIGGTYQYNDRLSFGASFLDLGWINWRNKTFSYQFQPQDKTYTFLAPDVDAVLDGDDESLESAEDSFEGTKFIDQSIPEYRTGIPARFYLSSNYQITRTTAGSAQVIGEIFRSRFAPALTFALHQQFGRRAGVSLSYMMTNNTYENVGFGFNLNFSPLQLYFCSDNALQLLRLTNPDRFIDNMQFVNVRTGLNFVFGRIKQQPKSQGTL